MIDHASITRSHHQASATATGNSMLFQPLIQPKLTVNQSNDLHEQEADAIAEKVASTGNNESSHTFFKPATSFEQRKCAHCEQEEKLQLKPQPAQQSSPDISSNVYEVINSSGQELDKPARDFMEPKFGHDFSNVRIHNDENAHQSSLSINARAYTHQNHIVFGAGQYQPDTLAGKQLLAHELTHVVQQGKSNFNHSMVQRAPDLSAIPCAFLLFAKEGGRVKGHVAHNHIGKDFESQVKSPVRIRIESGSFSHWRTEGNGDAAPSVIHPVIFNPLPGSRAGEGIPDLVNWEVSGTDNVFEIAEIKIATIGGYSDAILQVDNYVSKARAGNKVKGYNSSKKKYVELKGNNRFEEMPTSRFTPSSFTVGDKRVIVSWCQPGVILYKVLPKRKDDEEEQKRKVAKREMKPVQVVDFATDFYQYAKSASKTRAAPGHNFTIAIDSEIYKTVVDEGMRQRLRPMQIDPRGVPFIQLGVPLIPIAIAAGLIDILALGVLLAPAIALLIPEAGVAATIATTGAVTAETAAVAGTATAAGTYVTSTGVTLTVIEGGAAVSGTVSTAPAVIANLGKAAAVVSVLIAGGSSRAEAETAAKVLKDKKILAVLDTTNSGVQPKLGSSVNVDGNKFNVIVRLSTR